MKKIKVIFLLAFLPVFTLNSFADNDGTYKSGDNRPWSLLTGYYSYASIDQLFSDISYKGASPFISLRLKKKKKWVQETNFRFTILNRNPSIEIHQTLVPENHYLRTKNHLHFDVKDDYRFSMNGSENLQADWFLVASWVTSVDIIMNQGAVPELIFSSLAPGVGGSLRRGRLFFLTQVNTSILSYSCRSDYSLGSAQDYEKLNKLKFILDHSKILLPDNLLSLFFLARAGWTLNDHLNILFEYDFRYLCNKVPRKLSAVNAVYSLGCEFLF